MLRIWSSTCCGELLHETRHGNDEASNAFGGGNSEHAELLWKSESFPLRSGRERRKRVRKSKVLAKKFLLKVFIESKVKIIRADSFDWRFRQGSIGSRNF